MPDGNQAASGGTKDTFILVTLEKKLYTVSRLLKEDVEGTLICHSKTALHRFFCLFVFFTTNNISVSTCQDKGR